MALSYEEQYRQNQARAARTQAAVRETRRVPHSAYRFKVLIDYAGVGISQYAEEAACTEVSGLECSIKVVEYQEGGTNDYVHQFRGQASFPNLVLKRGLLAGDNLWRWHQDIVAGRVRRYNGAILLLDAAGDEAMSWSFTAAMPVKWSLPALNAASSALAFESVDFVHRGLHLVKPEARG